MTTTKCRRSKRMKNTTTLIPATTNMTPIIKFNYDNIHRNHTTQYFHRNRWRTPRQSPSRHKFTKFIPATLTTTRTTTNRFVSTFTQLKQELSFSWGKQHLWLSVWLLVTILMHQVQALEMTTSTYKTSGPETMSTTLYNQLWKTDVKNMHNADRFRPLVRKDSALIPHNVFQPSGQFRFLQPIDTDLRVAVPLQRRSKMSKPLNTSLSPAHAAQQPVKSQANTGSRRNAQTQEGVGHQGDSRQSSYSSHYQQLQIENHNKVRKVNEMNYQKEEEYGQQKQFRNINDDKGNQIAQQDDMITDVKSLEDLLADYATNFFDKGRYEPMPGLLIELQNYNQSQPGSKKVTSNVRSVRQTAATDAKIRIDLPRTLTTGRLLFLTGLKKVLWPVFMGLQIMKSVLIAMFIPAIIGSFTKLLGKGIATGSAPLFIRPVDPPQELDFRDNTLNFDEDTKFLINDMATKPNGPYAYNQPDASQIQNEYVFDPSSANNQLSYTRLGMNERQHQLMQDSYMSALQSIGSASFKNSGSLSSSSSGLFAPMAKRPPPAANVNTFQQFQNVPESSLLLSNYDPFYSPLLSRLDSVFAQLKINSDNEMCREKLICLMYANPAKYAPYSNLVSAQLSRELNELRKPTSDNPDILRFFKYMRAAKDGQDGVDCEKAFEKCTEFKDFDNPAMVSTYHDINKLVQARKLTTK